MSKKTIYFPHLHAHDEFSVKDGCSSVERYADIVVEQGGSCLAITNHGQASGWARQYFACQDRKIKPIFGMEAYLNEYRSKPIHEAIDKLKKMVKARRFGAKEKLETAQKFLKTKFRKNYHAILLAKTREGYRNLVRMSSDSWANGFYYAPRTDTSFLEEHSEGLIFSTACIGGYIPKMAMANYEAAVIEARRLQRIFNGDFYVELMITEYEEQRDTNEVMMRLAKEVRAPMIITCDVHYALPEDSLAQDCLLLMRDKKTIADKEAGEGVWQFESKDLWWRSLEDIKACYKEFHSDYMPRDVYNEAIKNTYRLADEIEHIEFDTSLKLPGVFKNPEGQLKDLVLSGIRERVACHDIPAQGRTKREYVERMQREFQVVKAKGFSEYFLVLHDICQHARSIGARMGPGRGSAGGSLIAYLLQITEVDPMKFNLLFERFLDINRPDPPDIDLDFSPEHRDGIKEYVEHKYPATASIVTFSTFKPRATLRDVGRVYGIDFKTMTAITKELGTDADKLSWDEIFDLWPMVKDFSTEHPKAFQVAKTLKGLISHMSVNAAGMLIAPARALDDLPMITKNGVTVTAYPDSQGDGVTYQGREITRLGYLKMDILGVRNLNIAPLAVEILTRETGNVVDLDAIPLDDQQALEVAATGDVPGIFQLDTHVTKPILRKVGVDRFMDLVMVTALARPGPLKENVHSLYAQLKRSGDWRDSVHPDLENVLSDSMGLMILQEDVMNVVQVLGGLSFEEANKVRKVIGKKLDPEAFEPWRIKFMEGGVALGRDEAMLADVWNKINRFAKYAFCKAHATAYMITAYRQLYMLAHHPTCYFAALLANTPRGKKNSKDDEKVIGYIRSAMAKDVRIVGPCVIKSGLDFDVYDGVIRYGLSKIKGVAGAAEAIVEARPFKTFEELFGKVDRRKANSRAFLALIYAGAMDDLPFDEGKLDICPDVETVIERRDLIVRRYHQLRRSRNSLEEMECNSPSKLIAKEKELLGMAFTWWASKDKDRIRKSEKLTTIACAIDTDIPFPRVLAEVVKLRKFNTRKGDKMAFVTLSDETGEMNNVTIWPEQLKEHRDWLKLGKIAVFRLRRQENRDQQYGRWAYFLDDRNRWGPSVEGAQRALRRALS